jgi:hypothetical protein
VKFVTGSSGIDPNQYAQNTRKSIQQVLKGYKKFIMLTLLDEHIANLGGFLDDLPNRRRYQLEFAVALVVVLIMQFMTAKTFGWRVFGGGSGNGNLVNVDSRISANVNDHNESRREFYKFVKGDFGIESGSGEANLYLL